MHCAVHRPGASKKPTSECPGLASNSATSSMVDSSLTPAGACACTHGMLRENVISAKVEREDDALDASSSEEGEVALS